ARITLLLDADGLNAHAGALERMAGRSAPTVMTPHAGELSRLLDRDSKDAQAHRLSSAREAAAKARAVIVLKGDDTIVAEPGGGTRLTRGRAPSRGTGARG